MVQNITDCIVIICSVKLQHMIWIYVFLTLLMQGARASFSFGSWEGVPTSYPNPLVVCVSTKLLSCYGLGFAPSHTSVTPRAELEEVVSVTARVSPSSTPRAIPRDVGVWQLSCFRPLARGFVVLYSNSVCPLVCVGYPLNHKIGYCLFSGLHYIFTMFTHLNI
jgi:hypothetical protein